jgi:uncharacterized protein (DUF1499 family)
VAKTNSSRSIRDMTNHDETRLLDGKLRRCPDSPNCVCSEHEGREHWIEPMPFSGDASDAWQRLTGILRNYPRTKIVSETADYIETRVRTRIFRFEDVLEFRLDRVANLIHVRSASRIGYSDLGANRRRVEAIRKLFCEE